MRVKEFFFYDNQARATNSRLVCKYDELMLQTRSMLKYKAGDIKQAPKQKLRKTRQDIRHYKPNKTRQARHNDENKKRQCRGAFKTLSNIVINSFCKSFHDRYLTGSQIGVKVFKNGSSKICGRQSLRYLKWYGLPKQTMSLQIF